MLSFIKIESRKTWMNIFINTKLSSSTDDNCIVNKASWPIKLCIRFAFKYSDISDRGLLSTGLKLIYPLASTVTQCDLPLLKTRVWPWNESTSVLYCN